MEGVSRRRFLKGAGVVSAVAAVAAGTALTGCNADSSSNSGEAGGLEANQGSHPYTVHEADVIIVGGGLSGLFAARRALKDGATVKLIDKGLYGHSGNSGINWGHGVGTNEWAPTDEETLAGVVFGWNYAGDGLIDQTLALNIAHALTEIPPAAEAEQFGSILERLNDGTSATNNGAIQGSENGLMPRAYAQLVKRMGCDVYDRTMAVELLFSEDGRVAGVAAIDLRNGTAKVFRGKAVIMAAGTHIWASGWNGMRAHTHGSPENTGEGLAMLLRAGLPMRDCEIFEQDQTQYSPLGLRNAMSTVGSQVTSFNWTYNANGEKFAEYFLEHPDKVSQGAYMRLTMKEIHEGRATENGCILVDTTNMEQIERFWRRTKEDQFRTLGYVVPDMVEVSPHFWNCGMRPFDLSDTCETAISGLFYAGEAPFVFSGMSVTSSLGTGWLAGKGAAEIAKSSDLPAVKWEDAAAAFDIAYEPLLKSGDGLRPFDAMRMVQEVFWKDLGLIRDEEGIQNGIAELERIKAEEIPRIVVTDKSRCMNNEWRQAMEVRGMVDCCLATGYASTVRTCSRGGTFCRTDYPELGDEFYNTKVAFDGTAWTCETVDIEPVVVDAETLSAILPRISFAHGVEEA